MSHNKYHKYYSQKHIERIKLVEEKPELFWHETVQKYIDSQITHPKSVWVQEIINNKREQGYVKLKTEDFILLPDTKNIYKKCYFQQQKRNVCFNWMVIVTDPGLRNIRDIRDVHIPLLEKIKQLATETIKMEFPFIDSEDVMIYANYPPSIHTLHFHFCFPFFSASAFDAFRIHSIDSIINNVRMSPDYYATSTFTVPLHERSPLYSLYKEIGNTDSPKNKEDAR
jgi:hypothetical protein